MAVAIILCLILALVMVLMFTGEIQYRYTDAGISVKASYYEDIEIAWEDITSAEYREGCDLGIRQMGYGSPKLSMGVFTNDAFGKYVRYTYTGCEACVILKIADDIVVLSGSDISQTKELYEAIVKRIEVVNESN